MSFLESGRARPSREMIHRLAETLAVPLRERNALLVAAGFAPTYREADPNLAAAELAPVRAAFDAILRQQEPYPAVILNRQWDLLEVNDAARRFFGFLLGDGAGKEEANQGKANLLRSMFSPHGLRPFVTDWEATAAALVGRVHREAVGGVIDEATRRLLEELLHLPGVPDHLRRDDVETLALPILPVSFAKAGKAFRFFSTVTMLGTPQDVLLQELRIECFFPLDAETRGNVEQMTSAE